MARLAPYSDSHLSIDFAHRKVVSRGATVNLTRKEYDLLAFLCQNAGEAVPRRVLLRRVWGYGEGVHATRTVDIHIHRLRKKLGPLSREYIETVGGKGYRFRPHKPPSKYVT